MQKPEHELAIAEILEPLYRDVGEYHKLVGVHEIQARHAGSVEQRVQLLHTIAELYEVQLGDLANAVEHATRARSREDPANERHQAQLERVALASQRR